MIFIISYEQTDRNIISDREGYINKINIDIALVI